MTATTFNLQPETPESTVFVMIDADLRVFNSREPLKSLVLALRGIGREAVMVVGCEFVHVWPPTLNAGTCRSVSFCARYV